MGWFQLFHEMKFIYLRLRDEAFSKTCYSVLLFFCPSVCPSVIKIHSKAYQWTAMKNLLNGHDKNTL